MNDREQKPGAMLLAALLAFAAAAVLALVLIYCTIRIRNPWIVHELDAGTDITEELAAAAQSPSPYVRIYNMDLTYTGYYEAGSAGEVRAYCYFGTAGEGSVLVGLPAQDGGALAKDSSAGGTFLKDASFSGRVVSGGEMAEHLARGEGMQPAEYAEQYHMLGLEIFSYGNDREKIIIYHLMILTGMIGCAAAGAVFLSEAAAGRQQDAHGAGRRSG